MIIVKRVVNGLAFYVGWLFTIGCAAIGEPVKGAAGAFLLIAFHIAINRDRLKETLMVTGLCLVGVVLDTFYMNVGMIEFTSPNVFFPHICPLWIVSLYGLFATSVDHSLFWLRKQPLLAAVLGSGGAMLSYLGGEAMGAAVLLLPYKLTALIIGVIWLFLTPAIYRFSDWLAGWTGDRR